MKTSELDDYNFILKRQKVIAANRRHECVIRVGGQSCDCWCYKAGPGGSHLPCPPISPEPAEVSCG
jgi:hypothetical protein